MRMLAALVATVLAFSFPAGGAARAEPFAYGPQKVVYHNNGRSGDAERSFKALLRNIANQLDAVGDGNATIRVVNHGDGVALLQLATSNKDLATALDGLRARGVRFLVCKNTLKDRAIDWKTLYGVKEEDLVASGIAELVKLQAEGFAYIHP